jgi:hypothetical protein
MFLLSISLNSLALYYVCTYKYNILKKCQASLSKKGVKLYSRLPPGNMLQMNVVQPFLFHEPWVLFAVITEIADIRHFVFPFWFESDLSRSQLRYQRIETSLGIGREFVKRDQSLTRLLITNRTLVKALIPAAFSNVAGLTVSDQVTSL